MSYTQRTFIILYECVPKTFVVLCSVCSVRFASWYTPTVLQYQLYHNAIYVYSGVFDLSIAPHVQAIYVLYPLQKYSVAEL